MRRLLFILIFFNFLNSNPFDFYPRVSVNDIEEILYNIIEELELERSATIYSDDPRGVVLEINGALYFPALSMDIKISTIELLIMIKEKIMFDSNINMIIEVHTDSDPIPVNRYRHYDIHTRSIWPTNSHLTAAQAASISELMISDGICLPKEDLNEQLLFINYTYSTNDINKKNCGNLYEVWFEMGIKNNRLTSIGYGEYWPYGVSINARKSNYFDYEYIQSLNKTSKQRDQNRRVKLIFYKT